MRIAKQLQRLARPVGELTNHPENPRRNDEALIAQSLTIFGQVKPIVVQNGVIIAGNHTYRAAVSLGATKIACVEFEGSEEEATAYLLADNRSSDTGRYDDVALLSILDRMAEADQLAWTLYDEDELASLRLAVDAALLDTPDEAVDYSTKVESPVYEPTGEAPPTSALADTERRDELTKQIDAAEVPEEVAEFLRIAAHRHVRFDYESIANYYAHAEPKVQRLMEASVLVIIDYEQAVERGFIQLHADVNAAFGQDYPDA